MSKGIMNRRDKMIWDNSALPTIDNVTGQINELAESVAGDIEDACEELDDKIDQAIVDCTYTAGDGINIDEDNKVNVKVAGNSQLGGIQVGDDFKISDAGVLALKQGKDPYDKDLYKKSYTLTNITDTAQTVSLNLISNPVAIYLQTGYVKDSSGNIYPITDTNYVSISFNGQTATVQAASGLTFVDGGFTIEYTIPELYYVPVLNTNLRLTDGRAGTQYASNTYYKPTKDQFLCAKTSQWSGDPMTIFISLTNQTGIGICSISDGIITQSMDATTSYTYNGHTIYYSTGGNSMSNWNYRNMIPSIMYNSVQTSGLAQFTSVENALKAFIDNYF